MFTPQPFEPRVAGLGNPDLEAVDAGLELAVRDRRSLQRREGTAQGRTLVAGVRGSVAAPGRAHHAGNHGRI